MLIKWFEQKIIAPIQSAWNIFIGTVLVIIIFVVITSMLSGVDAMLASSLNSADRKTLKPPNRLNRLKALMTKIFRGKKP